MGLGLGERGSVHVVVRAEDVALLAIPTEHIRHNNLQHVRGIVGALVEVAAKQRKQAVARLAHAGIHAGSVVDVDGLGPVLAVDPLQLLGDDVGSFVPANLLELALATRAHALHRIQQAIGMIQPLAHAAATQAGTSLEVRVVSRIVGFHVLNLAANRMPLEHAVAATVHIALAPSDLLFGCRFVGHGRRNVAEQLLGCRERAARCSQRPQCARRLHERSARKVGCRVRHIRPLRLPSRNLSPHSGFCLSSPSSLNRPLGWLEML